MKFRQDNKSQIHDRIKLLLVSSMKSAFQYIVQLKHTEKPNYELIKLWMSFDEEDEKKVF